VQERPIRGNTLADSPTIVFSPGVGELSYFVRVLEDLKLGKRYDGFLFLAESARNPPVLRSHHHVELELNLVVRGTITYVVDGRRFTFGRRALLWMFPAQEHQLVDRSDDAQYYVAVFKPGLIARSCRGATYEGLKRERVEGDGVLHTVLDPESFELIRKTMDAMVEDGLDPDVLNREAGFGVGSDFCFEHGDPDWLNAGLHHLLLLAWRCQLRGKALGADVALHPSVRRALEVLADGGDEGSLAAIARRCGASPAYLSRTFHRQIGVPLSRYRNSVLLARFLERYRTLPRGRPCWRRSWRRGSGATPSFTRSSRKRMGAARARCSGSC